MPAESITALFLTLLTVGTSTRVWLSLRQRRHVLAHRGSVPRPFAGSITLEAHQRAANYTVAKLKVGLIELVVSTLLLIGLTLGGGLADLHEWAGQVVGDPAWLRQLAFVGLVTLLFGLIDLPFSWYRQFVLEARFGFNRMTPGLFLADLFKGLLITLALGLPLVGTILWLMGSAGVTWWMWAWALWVGFNLLVLVLYPVLIAPLFNKFSPMPDGPHREQVEQLLARCNFASKGLFVMDGSRRSAHGNAYFTGLGRNRRIVFFDTLLAKLNPDEVQAVLAHELGHFKHHHIRKRILVSFGVSLLLLALLGWLAQQPEFYSAFGVERHPLDWTAQSLLLFFLVLPVFTFFVQPLSSLLSRRDEFEADRFAASQASADWLIAALVKLYEDNASTLTPDPVHSAFYDSHPPAAVRIAHLGGLRNAETLAT